MDAVKIDFTHPSYLVVQCCDHATYLSPNTINQMGPQTHHSIKFFLGRVSYITLGAPCNHIIAKMDQSNAAMTFVVSA